jgi:hypothetical protein
MAALAIPAPSRTLQTIPLPALLQRVDQRGHHAGVTDNGVTRDVPVTVAMQADSERVMVRDRHVRRDPAQWRDVDASTGKRDSHG